MDSFWHKDDAIPASSIDGLDQLLQDSQANIPTKVSQLENDSNYALQAAVTSALGGKLDKGTYTGNAQDLVDLINALGTQGVTVNNIDLKPTGNANEFTVELEWTDSLGNVVTNTDSTPILIDLSDYLSLSSTEQQTISGDLQFNGVTEVKGVFGIQGGRGGQIFKNYPYCYSMSLSGIRTLKTNIYAPTDKLFEIHLKGIHSISNANSVNVKMLFRMESNGAFSVKKISYSSESEIFNSVKVGTYDNNGITCLALEFDNTSSSINQLLFAYLGVFSTNESYQIEPEMIKGWSYNANDFATNGITDGVVITDIIMPKANNVILQNGNTVEEEFSEIDLQKISINKFHHQLGWYNHGESSVNRITYNQEEQALQLFKGGTGASAFMLYKAQKVSKNTSYTISFLVKGFGTSPNILLRLNELNAAMGDAVVIGNSNITSSSVDQEFLVAFNNNVLPTGTGWTAVTSDYIRYTYNYTPTNDTENFSVEIACSAGDADNGLLIKDFKVESKQLTVPASSQKINTTDGGATFSGSLNYQVNEGFLYVQVSLLITGTYTSAAAFNDILLGSIPSQYLPTGQRIFTLSSVHGEAFPVSINLDGTITLEITNNYTAPANESFRSGAEFKL